MRAKLKSYRLGEICDIFDGPHATPKKTAVGPIFLGISSLEQGRLNLAESECVSEEDFKKWTKRITPQPGDVVFSYETRLGEAAIIPEGLRCCLGRRMGLLRPKRDIVDPYFLLYFYLSPVFQELIRQMTVHGSTVDRIPLIEMPNWQVEIPEDIDLQRAIAGTAKVLDEKIELNRRLNEDLEMMARAIFKSWFVDFDPVHAKRQGKRPSGIDDAAAAIFPSSFEKSALGEIPKGWKVLPVYDTADWQNGMAFKATHFTDDGLPIIKIAELKNGIDSGTKRTNQEHEPKFRIKDGDILFSWSGSPDTSIDTFIWSLGPALLNQHVFKVTPKLGPAWSFGLLKHLKPIFIEIARNKQTTGLGHVTVSDLKRLTCCVPDEMVAAEYERRCGDLLGMYFNNQKETQMLTELRDLLLPRLLSGELTLKELP